MKLKNSIVILVFIVWLFWAVLYIGNHHICSTTFEVKSPKIPEEFNGYTIVQVSDLHNTKFGKNQARLIKRIEQNKPNVIVITGDLIYKRSKDMKKEISEVTDFVNDIVKIAPVYFVTGNHENQVGKENLKKIRESLANSGVTLLDETSTKLNFKGKHINLAGINDLEMYFDDYVDEYIKNSGKKIITIEEVIMIEENIIKRCLDKIKLDDSEFNVLLTHQPQYIEIYAKYKYDLVFSGHAHGGQAARDVDRDRLERLLARRGARARGGGGGDEPPPDGERDPRAAPAHRRQDPAPPGDPHRRRTRRLDEGRARRRARRLEALPQRGGHPHAPDA